LFLLQGFSLSTSWNYPSWSIGVEFYTYLVFYAAVALLGKVSPYWRYIGFIALSVLFFYLFFSHQQEWSEWNNMYRCISEFFLGVLIFGFYRYFPWQIRSSVLASFLEIVLLCGAVYSVIQMGQGMQYTYLSIFLFALIIYLFAVQKRGVVSRMLELGIFQHLGKISYSVYMVHAVIVTGAYNLLVYLSGIQAGGVEGIDTGIVVPYAWLLNTLFIVTVYIVATWTYRLIELPGQAYIKSKFVS
jgi:peptidoglycan/LPS O-acetylase OafA/YrhL